MQLLRETAPQDRPREKLLQRGPGTLADHELIAIILGSGNRTADVMSLAQRIVAKVDEHNTEISINHLTEIPGIGPAKAAQLVAAIEFVRRRIRAEGIKIRAPHDILPLVTHLADRKQETFICVSLNGAHEVIASRVVTIGLLNACQVHPREVFSDPIADRAAAIIVAHNHPSGDLTPSPEDRQVTTRLKDAADLLGLKFLDHIIFSKRGHVSLCCG